MKQTILKALDDAMKMKTLYFFFFVSISLCEGDIFAALQSEPMSAVYEQALKQKAEIEYLTERVDETLVEQQKILEALLTAKRWLG
jgi:hypothetical protein